MPHHTHTEGLKAARFLMVVASMAPLFVIWAIQGSRLICDSVWIPACLGIVVLSNLVLVGRFVIAKRNRDIGPLAVGHADDHRDHLLVYLFAMLLPFYNADPASPRSLVAILSALAFIAFLFWHLNLHYMNIVFAIAGYHVFTVHPLQDDNRLSGREDFVLISRRTSVPDGLTVNAYRISDTVYWEGKI